MTHVIVDRTFSPPLSPQDVFSTVEQNEGCFTLHRVRWHESLLAENGRIICHFESPDTESSRIALRETGSENATLWPTTVHRSAVSGHLEPSVIVKRSWNNPVEFKDIQAQEEAGAWCLETYDVKFVRSYFSIDRLSMFCLYAAPDTESVLQSQRQINMPLSDAWPIKEIKPV